MNIVVKELMYLDYTEEMEEKAIYYGYSKQKVYVAISVERDEVHDFNLKNSSNVVAANEKIISYFKFYFEQNEGKILFTIEERIITFLIPIANSNEYKTYLNKNLKLIMEQLYGWNNHTICVGIGGLIHHIQEFKRSSIEAREALKMLHACKKHNEIRVYGEMGIFRILFNVKDSKELIDILESTLGRLVEYDNKSDNDLVNTLEEYLIQNCNITKTAEILFLHRNTIKYRIQRIQEILLCDFNDANTCFNLRLAYKIRKFMMQ
jgi:DNA-binding PucR family transcriptional regulator